MAPGARAAEVPARVPVLVPAAAQVAEAPVTAAEVPEQPVPAAEVPPVEEALLLQQLEEQAQPVALLT